MLGAQIKGLQLQTLAPDLFNTWALQMPLGVWICRAQGFERVGWLVGNLRANKKSPPLLTEKINTEGLGKNWNTSLFFFGGVLESPQSWRFIETSNFCRSPNFKPWI